MAEALILTLNVGAMNERQLESESKASGSASFVLPAESPTNVQRSGGPTKILRSASASDVVVYPSSERMHRTTASRVA